MGVQCGGYEVWQKTIAALLLLTGGAAGIPLGFALSQAAPQMRVEIVLQQRVTDIPQPANLQVYDDRWDPNGVT